MTKLVDDCGDINLLGLSLIKSGDVIPVHGGGDVHVPAWLKLPLPRCAVPRNDISLVDLSMPVDENLFYRSMMDEKGVSKMIDQLSVLTEDNTVISHALLIGSSGVVLHSQRLYCFI